jgi:hypothetical protein
MIILILCIGIYIASCIGAYFRIRECYLPNGRWSNITPEFGDITMCFIPIVNTVIALFLYSGRKTCNKFFRIPKK